MARHTISRVSRGKVMLTLAVVAAGATAVGAGTYASFTASTSQSLSVTSGTESLGFGATNRLSVNVTGIVPGDTMQREVDVSNTGNQPVNAITLTTNATATSLLDSDATNGLQMVVDRCSQAWTEAGVSPAYTYTCAGTQTNNIIPSRAVIGSGLPLAATLAVGGTDYLRVTLSFPSAAGNMFQGLSSTIAFTFNGTQRANSAH
jgi:predicted ribosomally synthesized peptide with SipW-like signal peptide